MIRMTKLAAGPSGVMNIGSEHTFAPDVEAEYIRSGAAVRVGSVEVATKPEPKENAAKRTRRVRRKK